LIPSKSLRDWASNLRLRVSPTDLQILEHVVRVRASGLYLLLLELSSIRLEHRPWSLPICVAASGGLWSPQSSNEITPHLKSSFSWLENDDRVRETQALAASSTIWT
jgi:hypothetical protein